MEQTFERIEKHFYKRRYTAGGHVKTRYYALFTDWQGIRRRLPLGENQARARNKLGELLRKNDAEFDFDQAKTRNVTLSAWAAQCKNAMRERDATLLNHVKDYFGSMALNKIDDKDLIDYRAQRLIEPVIKRGKKTAKLTSPTTVNKELGLLRKLMRLARPKGFIKAMPAFEMDREPSRERRLTAEEYSKLLEGSPAWLRRVCIAAFETALSRSDLLGLTWKEIDQKTNVIVLEDGRDKTKVRQEIPIRTESLIELFAELKAESKKLPNIDELVFTRDGRRIKPMQLRRALQRACKAAKIEGFTFHDFRHCAITRWHAMSVPVSVAMIMSGHTSVQSHKKYVNLRTQEVAEVFTGCLQRNSELQKKSASA